MDTRDLAGQQLGVRKPVDNIWFKVGNIVLSAEFQTERAVYHCAVQSAQIVTIASL